MIKNVTSYFDQSGAYHVMYPEQPAYRPDCPNNVKYDTLPDAWPRRETIMGPTSMKHIYTGIPNYYPPMKLSRPIGTMYEADLSRFSPHGRRESYGFQAYPFHHQSNFETREYSDSFIPVLDYFDFTKYKTLRDGAFSR